MITNFIINIQSYFVYTVNSCSIKNFRIGLIECHKFIKTINQLKKLIFNQKVVKSNLLGIEEYLTLLIVKESQLANETIIIAREKKQFLMDEIYQLVKFRINKVHELNKIFSSPDENLKVEDIRKAKEDEKFRTEKENWILNVLKALKDYTNEQKQILCEKSIDIMKLIWPEFQLKYQLQFGDEFNKNFLETYLKIYSEFFQPFEQTYEFRLTLRQVSRPNNVNSENIILVYLKSLSILLTQLNENYTQQNLILSKKQISIVPDMLKYLVEFSRDYFKKFMIFLAIQRQKQAPQQNQTVNQNGNIQIATNSNINNPSSNVNIQQMRSKSSASKIAVPEIQNSINKQQNSKQAVQNSKVQSQIQSSNLDKTQKNEKPVNKLLIPKRKSISLYQKEDNINFIGKPILQVIKENQPKVKQQINTKEMIPLQSDILQIKAIGDGIRENQNINQNNQMKQPDQNYSSPSFQIQAQKANPYQDLVPDERQQNIQTPIQLYDTSPPQSERLSHQVNIFQHANFTNQSFYPAIKKQDLSIFPSTLSISWFISKEKEIKIARQTNINQVITDLDNTNILAIDGKVKKAKGGIEDLKLMYIQIYEQLKQKNGLINSTIQQYFDKYKSKFPKKIKIIAEKRDKEEREQFKKIILQNQSFSTYYYFQNEDILGPFKKNEQLNFNQTSTQKIFAAKSAKQRNRKYYSQAITPPPNSSKTSVLNYSNNQKGNFSSNQQQFYSNNQILPINQTANQTIQQNQSPNNTIYNINNNFSQNKPNTNSQTSQLPSFASIYPNQPNQQQQQRTFSPLKYNKVDHSNIQNKLKIIRLSNTRCNSALLKPRINQTQNNIIPNQNENNQVINEHQVFTISSQEIKSYDKISQQKVERNLGVRQKSLSVMDTKQEIIFQQKNNLSTEQLQLEGKKVTNIITQNQNNCSCEDLVFKTQSKQETDDNNNKNQKQGNSLDDNFALPLLNLKQNYKPCNKKRLSGAINIQDDNELELQNSLLENQESSENRQNNKKKCEQVKEQSQLKSERNGQQDNQPNTPTNDQQSYYVLQNKKRKNLKKSNDQLVEDADRFKSQTPQPPSNIKELIQSQQFHKEALSKTQRNHKNQQNQLYSANNQFSKDLDSLQQNKLFDDQNINQQAISQIGEEHKTNLKKNSGDGSEVSSSESSSQSQNLVYSFSSQLPNDKKSKNSNYRYQQINNLQQNGSLSNCESLSQTQQQLNKLPLISQSENRKGISFGSVDLRNLQTTEDDQKNIKKNQSTQPHLKKVQDYSNMLNNFSNQNLQKEYITLSNNLYNNNYDFNNNKIANNNKFNSNNNSNNVSSKLISSQNNYSNNKISIINHPITVPQQEDYMKNIPSNINMMTDKFKNLLIQKINKIKGEKIKQQQQEQQFKFENNQILYGGNCIEVGGNCIEIGGNNGVPVKVKQQIKQKVQLTIIKQQPQQTLPQVRNSQIQQEQQQTQVQSQSQTRIIQKYDIFNNNTNMNSQQHQRQNHFNDQNVLQQKNQENIKSTTQINNQISENGQQQNMMQIKKNKNKSYSVDRQECFSSQNNPLKVVNKKDS